LADQKGEITNQPKDSNKQGMKRQNNESMMKTLVAEKNSKSTSATPQ
jgi:hypothetical protein